MLLVIGGAYAGKRQVVRERISHPLTWFSAYEKKSWLNWEHHWAPGSCFVLEGWEVWLKKEIQKEELLKYSNQVPDSQKQEDLMSEIQLGSSLDEIRCRFRLFLDMLKQEEAQRLDHHPAHQLTTSQHRKNFTTLSSECTSLDFKHQVVLIMLEMGRGIVPLQQEERMWRDLAGWIAQDATNVADEVIYVWHGLPRIIKTTQSK